MIYVLFAHYLNDFIGQNCVLPKLEIGKNKSKSDAILCLHVLMYTLGMSLMMLPFMSLNDLALFAMLNGSTHFVIDAITSCISSWAYENKRYRLFWNTIGFDQFLHVAILYISLP